MYKPIKLDIQSLERSSYTLETKTPIGDERRIPHVTASGVVSRPSIESWHAVTDRAGTSNTVESTQKEGGFGSGPAARRNHLWLEASSSGSESSSAGAKQRKSYQRQISAPEAGRRGAEGRGFGQEWGKPLPMSRPISLADLGKLLPRPEAMSDLGGVSESESSSAGAKQRKSYQRQISAPEAGRRGAEGRGFGQEREKPLPMSRPVSLAELGKLLPRPEALRKQTSATDLVGASESGSSEEKDKGLYDKNIKVLIDFTVKQVKKQAEENEDLKRKYQILEDKIISKELNYLEAAKNLEVEREKAKDEEIRELKREMINKDGELRKEYDKIRNLQQEIQNKDEELSNKYKAIGELERQLYDRDRKLIDKDEQIRKLVEEISNKDREMRGKDASIRALEDQMSDKDEEINRKDKQIERLYRKNNILREENKILIKKGVETENELEKRGELIKMSKDEIIKKDKKIKDREVEITNLKEERDRLTQKVEDRDRVIDFYREGYRMKRRI
jgi:hypothetical protein